MIKSSNIPAPASAHRKLPAAPTKTPRREGPRRCHRGISIVPVCRLVSSSLARQDLKSKSLILVNRLLTSTVLRPTRNILHWCPVVPTAYACAFVVGREEVASLLFCSRPDLYLNYSIPINPHLRLIVTVNNGFHSPPLDERWAS